MMDTSNHMKGRREQQQDARGLDLASSSFLPQDVSIF